MLVHLFVNPHADGTDSTKTQPSHWNAEHAFSGSNTGSLLYRDVLAANGANWLTPSPSAGYALLSSGAGAPPTWGPVTTPSFPLAATAGGTGVANAVGSTITLNGAVNLAGAFSTVGAFALVLNVTAGTSVTFPTSGTLLSTTSPALTANAIVLGGGSGVVPTVVGSLGTTTTLLHGNAAGAPSFGAVVNADIANATIDLTTKVTGTLPMTNGGLGVTTFTNHGVLLGQATASPVATAAGTAGQILVSGGASADPSWKNSPFTTIVRNSDTGTQNNWAPGIVGNTLIIWAGASAMTVTGIAAGTYDGQMIRILSGTTNIASFLYNNAGSLAASRLINYISSAAVSITSSSGNGYIDYVYDLSAALWRCTGHKQGAWITPTFTAGNFTAVAAMTWTVAIGQMTTAKYLVEGNTVFFVFSIDGSALGVAGTAEARIGKAAYGDFTGISQTSVSIAFVSDGAGTYNAPAQIQMNAGSTFMRILKNTLAAWTTGSFTLYISGQFEAS